MNFQDLKEKLQPNLLSLVKSIVPGGKLQGKEYQAASIRGGHGTSFSFNTHTGVWADFATDHKGGDIIALYALVHQVTQGEAYLALGGELPGNPVATYPYKSSDGKTLMAVARYESNGHKSFKPWIPDDEEGLKAKFPEGLRPLYGLEDLTLRQTAPVLIVEGEKAAEAAKTLLPQFVVCTWSGGAKSVSKTDFSPLKGRYGVLWPDADKPGIEAMQEVLAIVKPMWQWVKVLDVVGKADGWDAADALAEGMRTDKIHDWIGETEEVKVLVPSFRFKPESVADFLKRPEPPLTWLIDSLWVEGARGFIAGSPNIGKTWMALEMLLSVSTGQLCLNQYKPSRQRPCLLIEEEGSLFGLARRIHKLARGRGLQDSDLTNFYHITRQVIKIQKDEQELIAYVKSRGIEFIVFDSLKRFHDADENSAEKMSPVLDAFARLGLETGASIAIIHHLSKQGEKDKRSVFERMRGTGDLLAWRDCVIGMSGPESSPIAECSFQFRDAENPLPIHVSRNVDQETGAITLSSVDIEPDFADEITKITTWLSGQFGGRSFNKMYEALKGNRSKMSQAWQYMERRHIIVQEGSGFMLNNTAKDENSTK